MRLEELVFKKFSSLNETDLFIWSYISAHKEACSKASIEVLSDACSVSRTTISRFVRKLGLGGYSEFKVYLGWELNEELLYHDQSYEKACDSVISFVEDLKTKNFDAICKLLYESKGTFAYGSGDIQSALAKQIKRMFLSSQEIIYDFGSITFDSAFYEVIGPDNVIILISLSGESDQIIEIAKRIKMRGSKIISITKFKENRLARISDENIYVALTELSILDDRPMFETMMVYFVLVELLFIKYSIFKRNKKQKSVELDLDEHPKESCR